jgi:hypothetical protein
VKESGAIAAAIEEALARHRRKSPNVRFAIGHDVHEEIEQSDSERAAQGRRSERP